MTAFSGQGGCSCGAVRFGMKAAPMFVHCCHCLDCQKQTGGAFAINALIEAEEVELLADAPVAVSMPTNSGRPHHICRCEKCEVAVWSIYGRRPWLRFVRVSALDQPHSIEPDVHIYTRSKVPWVRLPADKPAFETYYDMSLEWPAEALERHRAAEERARG